jgi:1-acyl-sn-glycerol-3-phosphate acyltransferase
MFNRSIKLLRLLLLLIDGGLEVTWRWSHLTPLQAQERVMNWAQRACRVLGVSVEVNGDMSHPGPLLVVSNHISWLDILIYLSIRPVRFVAKSEVKSWPVVGRFASACRTLFVTRASKKDALRVVHQMVQALSAGDIVAIFPEGTTTQGHDVLPFHANLMQASVSSNSSVQAVHIAYECRDGARMITEPSFIGDDTLVGSIWTILGLAPFRARVTWSEVQARGERDRRELAQDLHQTVRQLKPRY